MRRKNSIENRWIWNVAINLKHSFETSNDIGRAVRHASVRDQNKRGLRVRGEGRKRERENAGYPDPVAIISFFMHVKYKSRQWTEHRFAGSRVPPELASAKPPFRAREPRKSTLAIPPHKIVNTGVTWAGGGSRAHASTRVIVFVNTRARIENDILSKSSLFLEICAKELDSFFEPPFKNCLSR